MGAVVSIVKLPPVLTDLEKPNLPDISIEAVTLPSPKVATSSGVNVMAWAAPVPVPVLVTVLVLVPVKVIVHVDPRSAITDVTPADAMDSSDEISAPAEVLARTTSGASPIFWSFDKLGFKASN